MARKKKKGCMSCVVTLLLLGLIGSMILGAAGFVVYLNRERFGILSIEEYQEKIDEAVKSAESGKGFSGSIESSTSTSPIAQVVPNVRRSS